MSLGCLGSKEGSLRKRFSTASHVISGCPVGRALCTGSAVSRSVAILKNCWLRSDTVGLALTSVSLSVDTMKAKKEAQCAASGERQLFPVDEKLMLEGASGHLHCCRFRCTLHWTITKTVQDLVAEWSELKLATSVTLWYLRRTGNVRENKVHCRSVAYLITHRTTCSNCLSF